MTEKQIENTIIKAKTGIEKYLEIMMLFPKVNVATDLNFQRKYNAFYRVRQRNHYWYQTYYTYMEDQKGREVKFPIVLRYFKENLERYEPSFSSKFVATHNPNMPIWDSRVLSAIGIKPPYYSSPTKYNKAEAIYSNIENWYVGFLASQKGINIVRKFNELISGSNLITDIKKIDFVLWKLGT